MPTDVGVLTFLLEQFLAVLTPAYGRIAPHSLWVFGMLAGIEGLLLILWWLAGAGPMLPQAVGLMLHIGLFLYLLQNYAGIVTDILHSFVELGLMAGGGSISIGTFLNPSAIASFGVIAGQPIAAKLGTYGVWSYLSAVHLPDIFMYGLAWLFIVAGFYVAAILVFITILGFVITTIAGLALFPFVASRYTSFLAQGPIAMVFNTAIRLFILALLTSIAYPLMERFVLPLNPTLPQAWGMVLGSAGLGILYWYAPALGAGLMAGVPNCTLGMAFAPLAMGASLASTAATRGATLAVGGAQQATRALTAGATALQQGDLRALPAAGAALASQSAIGAGFRAAVRAGRVAGGAWQSRQVGGQDGVGLSRPSVMGQTSARQGEGWDGIHRPPEDWRTGGEAMTPKQAFTLQRLGEDPPPDMTKAEASRRIMDLGGER
jgi:type IV secretion system protein TrbL